MTGHALLPDGQTRGPRWRAGLTALLVLLLAARGASQDAPAPGQPAPTDGQTGEGRASVTISGDDQLADALTWRIPPVELAAEHPAVPGQQDRLDVREILVQRRPADARSLSDR